MTVAKAMREPDSETWSRHQGSPRPCRRSGRGLTLGLPRLTDLLNKEGGQGLMGSVALP